MFDNKKIAKNKELVEYLESFVTERRLELIDKILAQRTRRLTVVIEDVWHSPNASALLRTSECLGLQDVHIIENRAKFKANTRVVQGAAKWLDLKRFNKKNENNSVACLEKLRDEGYLIVATTLKQKNTVAVESLPIDQKLAVCFGCEETGLSDTIHEAADYFVTLPMYGFTESFNISVSAGMILSSLGERLRKGGQDFALSPSEKEIIRAKWLRNSIKNQELLIKNYLQ